MPGFRERYTGRDIARLGNLAKEYPIVRIASEPGPGASQISTKVQELRLSLRSAPQLPRQASSFDPGAAGLEFTG